MIQIARMFLYALGTIAWSLSVIGFSVHGMTCLQDNPEDLIFVLLSFNGMVLCYPYAFYCGRMTIYVAKGGT